MLHLHIVGTFAYAHTPAGYHWFKSNSTYIYTHICVNAHVSVAYFHFYVQLTCIKNLLSIYMFLQYVLPLNQLCQYVYLLVFLGLILAAKSIVKHLGMGNMPLACGHDVYIRLCMFLRMCTHLCCISIVGSASSPCYSGRPDARVPTVHSGSDSAVQQRRKPSCAGCRRRNAGGVVGFRSDHPVWPGEILLDSISETLPVFHLSPQSRTGPVLSIEEW